MGLEKLYIWQVRAQSARGRALEHAYFLVCQYSRPCTHQQAP